MELAVTKLRRQCAGPARDDNLRQFGERRLSGFRSKLLTAREQFVQVDMISNQLDAPPITGELLPPARKCVCILGVGQKDAALNFDELGPEQMRKGEGARDAVRLRAEVALRPKRRRGLLLPLALDVELQAVGEDAPAGRSVQHVLEGVGDAAAGGGLEAGAGVIKLDDD